MKILICLAALGAICWLGIGAYRAWQDAMLDKAFRYYQTMARGCLGDAELRILSAELAELLAASKALEAQGVPRAKAARIGKRAAIQSIINHVSFCSAFPDPDNAAYVERA